MIQSLILKIAGLYTSYNQLGSAPEGALLKADNIDIAKDNIAEPRRGFERLPGAFASSSDRADKTWFYQDKHFAHHGPVGSANTISYLNSGTWTQLGGTYSAPPDGKLRTLQASENLYFTTSAGVYRQDTYNSTPVLAGAYKGLDVEASVTGTTGFLENDYAVAYRVVWGYTDANSNLILGAPSQRSVVKNSAGGTRNVQLTFTVPEGVTEDWIFQVYRSAQVDNSSEDVEPNDELQLVYEGSPDAADITNGYVSLTDSTVDELRGATIYTAPSQEGLASQNERPPLANDIASFRGSVFYANVVNKHRYYLTLIAVGGAGLAVGDTITIGGITYTADPAEDVSSAKFKRSSLGSASQNIKDTALSLVKVINRHSSSTVYAYYLSGEDDLPGRILLEERDIGGSAFAITTSNSSAWNPSGIPSSGTSETSTSDAVPNGLMWSKPFEPEAVPLTNFTQVGSKSAKILRIIALKDALLIFKEDGIYRLTGYYPNFDIELLDESAKIIGAETPAILNNQIYCLSDQGVIAVSDGVKIVSRPIEQDLQNLLAADLSGVRSLSFGIGYETERKYYLFTVSGAGDANATQAYVYNIFTNAWVRHTLASTTGVVEENHLYLGDAASNYLLKDKKSNTYADYADFGFSTTITSIDGSTIAIGAGVADVAVGDILYQSATKFATVTSVDSVNANFTVDTNPGFTQAACDILKAISVDIRWAPVTLGNPGITKQVHTTQLLFKKEYSGTGYMKFETDLSPAEESVPIGGQGIGVWGLFPWGQNPWGGVQIRRPNRAWIPLAKQRCSQITVSFTHAFAYSPWELEGVSIHGTAGSDKTVR